MRDPLKDPKAGDSYRVNYGKLLGKETWTVLRENTRSICGIDYRELVVRFSRHNMTLNPSQFINKLARAKAEVLHAAN